MICCKYCDEPRNGYAILRATGRPAPELPENTAWVCAECSERGEDWFHDSDMEDRS